MTTTITTTSSAAEGMAFTVVPSNIGLGNRTYMLDISADTFAVDWGDGVIDSRMEHTYADGDREYTVQVTGANITKLSQGATIWNNGLALTALLRMHLPNLNDTRYMFRTAENIHDWSGLSLPDGVTSIGYDTFLGCSSLALTSLPSGLTRIETYAFNNCSRLALASLPSGLTRIGYSAFRYCSGLSDVVFLGKPSSIASTAFGGTSANLFVPWSEGEVDGAPWGTKGTITYNHVS